MLQSLLLAVVVGSLVFVGYLIGVVSGIWSVEQPKNESVADPFSKFQPYVAGVLKAAIDERIFALMGKRS